MNRLFTLVSGENIEDELMFSETTIRLEPHLGRVREEGLDVHGF